jgi:predicted transcriptional regulator
MALSNLVDKGLVSMVVNEDGKLAYKTTDKGRDLGTLIKKMKNGKIK